jgi:hypothetical protein
VLVLMLQVARSPDKAPWHLCQAGEMLFEMLGWHASSVIMQTSPTILWQCGLLATCVGAQQLGHFGCAMITVARTVALAINPSM